MPEIHPTAIVDPRAEIGDDVVIGPHCIIDGPARVGAGCRLIANVYLHNKVTLGKGNVLYPNVCIGFQPQSRRVPADAETAGVIVGNRNVLREGVTIHQSSKPERATTLGDQNYLMSNAHMGHDVRVGNDTTIASGSLLAGHVDMADQALIGGGSAIQQFVRIGRLAMIGGISGAASDVPPFAMMSGINNIVGINKVGLRRAGAEGAAIDQVREAYDTLYLAGHTRPVAIETLRNRAADGVPGASLLLEIADFVENSERGLCPHSATNARHSIRR